MKANGSPGRMAFLSPLSRFRRDLHPGLWHRPCVGLLAHAFADHRALALTFWPPLPTRNVAHPPFSGTIAVGGRNHDSIAIQSRSSRPPCTTRPSGLPKQGSCKVGGVPAVLPNWAAKTATKTTGGAENRAKMPVCLVVLFVLIEIYTYRSVRSSPSVIVYIYTYLFSPSKTRQQDKTGFGPFLLAKHRFLLSW